MRHQCSVSWVSLCAVCNCPDVSLCNSSVACAIKPSPAGLWEPGPAKQSPWCRKASSAWRGLACKLLIPAGVAGSQDACALIHGRAGWRLERLTALANLSLPLRYWNDGKSLLNAHFSQYCAGSLWKRKATEESFCSSLLGIYTTCVFHTLVSHQRLIARRMLCYTLTVHSVFNSSSISKWFLLFLNKALLSSHFWLWKKWIQGWY